MLPQLGEQRLHQRQLAGLCGGVVEDAVHEPRFEGQAGRTFGGRHDRGAQLAAVHRGQQHGARAQRAGELRDDDVVERGRAQGQHGVHLGAAVVCRGYPDQLAEQVEQLVGGVRVGGGELLELVHHEHQTTAGSSAQCPHCLQASLRIRG